MRARSGARRSSSLANLVWVLAVSGCGEHPGLGRAEEPVVYGEDGRVEPYEALDPSLEQTVAESAVAFVPNGWVDASGAVSGAPRLGDTAGLCPGQRFEEQPAAAFCSGILIDEDLVLTAAHCLRVFALDDFRVVAGYYYERPGTLALGEAIAPLEILEERLDRADSAERLDFALLRLARSVTPPRRAAAVYRHLPMLADGDSVHLLASSAGVPFKVDSGGRIIDARATVGDYFRAATDSSHGASGGGAFDAALGLVGILARGGRDLETTEAGCNRERVVADDGAAEEELTYAHRAVEALCTVDPSRSLCRDDCEEPCRAARSEATGLEASCSIQPGHGHACLDFLPFLLALAGLQRRRGGAQLAPVQG